ncbi:hypothetical protein LCGC14_1908340, partial [marine sediment metagenome]
KYTLFDKNNKLICWGICHKDRENFYKVNPNGGLKGLEITQKEFKWIEFKKREKEYLSRTKCSRFELMDI